MGIRGIIGQCAASPSLVFMTLAGLGFTLASVAAYVTIINPEVSVLISSQLTVRLAFFPAAGAGCLVSVGALCVLRRYGRWRCSLMLTLLVYESLSIAAACSGFVYSYSFLWSMGTMTVDDTLASQGYGRFQDITAAWDKIEVSYSCVTNEYFMTEKYNNWRYRDEGGRVGPAWMFLSNSSRLGCEEAWGRHHGGGRLGGLFSCRQQCSRTVPGVLRTWFQALSAGAVIMAAMQLGGILYVITSQCACAVRHRNKMAADGPTKQVRTSLPFWQMTCALGRKTCTCALSSGTLQEVADDEDEKIKLIIGENDN